jgi:acyl-CoA thioesterase I
MKMNAKYILLSLSFFLLVACEKSQAVTVEPEIPVVPEEPPVPPTIDTIHYLALGDSYTIGHGVAYAERFPVQLVRALRQALPDSFYLPEPHIVARTGWTTGQLLNATANNDTLLARYGLVSLLIGVNNQYQRQDFALYEQQFPQLLSRAIAFAGGDTSRVIVLSIPDYAYTPFGQGSQNPAQISAQLDAYNAFNRQVAESWGVAYFDITPISRQGLAQPELVAGDRLHPSGLMYHAWVELMLEEVASRVEDGG